MSAPSEDLVHAIRVVAAGAALLDPAVTRRVIEESARSPSSVAVIGPTQLARAASDPSWRHRVSQETVTTTCGFSPPVSGSAP
jgi:hypothetical protein